MGHMIWHNVIHTEMTEKCLGRTENTSQGTQIREDPAEHMGTQACRKQGGRGADTPQRAKFAQKVHKPPLEVNVINFELNECNAFIWVPWSPSDPKKLSCIDRNIQIHRCVERNKLHTLISLITVEVRINVEGVQKLQNQ